MTDSQSYFRSGVKCSPLLAPPAHLLAPACCSSPLGPESRVNVIRVNKARHRGSTGMRLAAVRSDAWGSGSMSHESPMIDLGG